MRGGILQEEYRPCPAPGRTVVSPGRGDAGRGRHETSAPVPSSRVRPCGSEGTYHLLERKYVPGSCPPWQEACCSSWRIKKTHGHLHLDDETRRLLLQMSPDAAGKLLGGRTVCTGSVIPGVPLWVEDSRSDVHGPSAPHPWDPGRGPGGSRGRAGRGRLRLDTHCHGLYHRTPPGRSCTHERRSGCGRCTGILSPQISRGVPFPRMLITGVSS